MTSFKKCSKCKVKLPLKEFNWKIKDVKLAVHCKNCSRKYIRQHYKDNRQYYVQKARLRNLRVKKVAYKYVYDYLKKNPCVDCGEKDILVLEFDHKKKTRKDGAVSRIISNTGSISKLKNEISKCEVRCANCHRRKTSIENNIWKTNYAPVA